MVRKNLSSLTQCIDIYPVENKLLNKEKAKEYNLIVSCGRTSAPYNLILSKKKYTQNYHILDPYFGRKFLQANYSLSRSQKIQKL